MEKVLGTPELVYCIVDSAPDNGTLYRTALSSKRFLEPALDSLWSEINNFGDLLSILCPMGFQNDDEDVVGWDFLEEDPSEYNWSRFHYCASRVRRVNVMCENTCANGSYVSRIAFERLQSYLHRPNRVIEEGKESLFMPKLVSFTWIDDPRCLRYSPLFLHPDVKYLSLGAFSSEELETPNVMTSDWTGAAETYVLAVTEKLTSDQDQINAILNQMEPSLRQLTLPYNTFGLTGLLGRLADLPQLEHLYFSRQFMRVQLFESSALQLKSTELPGDLVSPFRVLRSLSLLLQPLDLERWLAITAVGHRLESLEVISVLPLDPALLMNTLTFLASSLPNLRRLTLDAHQYWVNGDINNDIQWRYDYECISPVLGFKNLTDFRLFLNVPLHITNDDVYTLASSWPGLKTLYLNHVPPLGRNKPTEVSIAALAVFAACCPDLTELGLYPDPSIRVVDLPQLTGQHRRFGPSLRTLNFGTSPVGDNLLSSTAMFLSDLISYNPIRQGAKMPLNVTGGTCLWDVADRDTDRQLLNVPGQMDESTLWSRLKGLCELVLLSIGVQRQIDEVEISRSESRLETLEATLIQGDPRTRME